ncbi:MAG: phospholipase D-like domain-containing protein [Planctomycetota bacterium]|jgi:phosphatidylserine/phosphatidylglycerophosphate/cardiolipin synthase-like enzyme
MKKYLLAIFGVTLAASLVFLGRRTPVEAREKTPSIAVHFSPDGGASKAISTEIRNARKSLDVALYMLTASSLAWDIVAAHKRGVKVRVILDKRMVRKWSQEKTLRENGVPLSLLLLSKSRKDPSPPQFHHKFAVIDGKTVVTGSTNWTVMADQRNHENLLVIRDTRLASQYTSAFEKALRLVKDEEGD